MVELVGVRNCPNLEVHFFFNMTNAESWDSEFETILEQFQTISKSLGDRWPPPQHHSTQPPQRRRQGTGIETRTILAPGVFYILIYIALLLSSYMYRMWTTTTNLNGHHHHHYHSTSMSTLPDTTITTSMCPSASTTTSTCPNTSITTTSLRRQRCGMMICDYDDESTT